MKKILSLTIIIIWIAMGSAYGTTLDLSDWRDITIWDKMAGSNENIDGVSSVDTRSAYDPRGQKVYSVNEDNEAEVDTPISPSWDMEGVFLKDNLLALVGEYDFKGVEDYWDTSAPGDVFISTDIRFENPAHVSSRFAPGTSGNRGYEIALDLHTEDRSDPGSYTYDFVWIGSGGAGTRDTTEVVGSSPWTLIPGGGIRFSTGHSVAYYDGTSGVHFSGENHYALVLDLSILGSTEGIYTHFAMQSGLDNLKGYTGYAHQYASMPIANPEPTTMLLLGFGLIGMAGLARKKFPKRTPSPNPA